MAKLIILSIVIVTMAVPILVADHPKQQAALKKALAIIIVLIVIWAMLCLRVYPVLVPLD